MPLGGFSRLLPGVPTIPRHNQWRAGPGPRTPFQCPAAELQLQARQLPTGSIVGRCSQLLPSGPPWTRYARAKSRPGPTLPVLVTERNKNHGMDSSPHLKRPVDPSFSQPRYYVCVGGAADPKPAVLSAGILRRRPPSAGGQSLPPSDPVRGPSNGESWAAFSLPLSPCLAKAKCLVVLDRPCGKVRSQITIETMVGESSCPPASRAGSTRWQCPGQEMNAGVQVPCGHRRGWRRGGSCRGSARQRAVQRFGVSVSAAK